MEEHLLMNMLVSLIAFGQQQLGGSATEQLAGLTHGAERDCSGSSELDVVVADDRQIDGNVDPHAGHLLEQTEREQIVGTEGRCWPTGTGQTQETLAGALAFGDV